MHEASEAHETGWEIERKFLVAAPPSDLDEYRYEEVRQGYLGLEGGDAAVRVRQKGDGCFLTIKQGEGLRRREVEVALSREQFEALWPMTEGRRLEKRRYRIPYAGRVIELDVYRGALSGLITAEVEFASAAEGAAFTPPAWFGPDVTDDARYSNKHLAAHGLPARGDPDKF